MEQIRYQTDPIKRHYVLMLLVVFIGYTVFGFSENIKGPAVPRMQADFGLDEMQLGLLLALNSLGYLLACSFTGWMVGKWGLKLSTSLAFGSMALSGVFIYLSATFGTFALSYFFMYIGNGILEIALAILGARVFTKNTGAMMNLSHFFYGLSSTVAPIAAAALMGVPLGGEEIGWRGMYLIMLSLSVLPMIPALAASFPAGDDVKAERISIKQFMGDRVIWLIVLLLSFGVISELAVGGWLVNFLEKAYGWSSSASSYMLSAFFLCFTLARLVLGVWTDKIGYIKSIIVYSAFSGACTVAAIASGESGAVLFAAAGIGIAPVYPTVMAFLARKYAGNSDMAITFTVTFMGVASIVGNFLVGAISDLFRTAMTAVYGPAAGIVKGLQAGYLFIGVCAWLCSLTGIVLYRRLKRDNALM
ncbi:MFS transporter [Paenibacillus thailandensis]|uniref:MFS transporter n=1 Tax=Paenibacillus thailandensis TaxID=393250 RepID=A0ABW5QWD3_9BACL